MNAPRTRASSVKRRPVHGLLLLDKPLGLSSNDALQKAKWLLRAEKAGHTGTLDPLATGVLPLCFGAATKFSQLHLEADKSYDAVAKLGQKTSTGDAEGDVIESRPLPWCAQGDAPIPSPELIRVQQQFTGPIQQVPPMYSALKRDGKALYEYAREGIEVERAPRAITITDFSVSPTDDPAVWDFEVHCSVGTYVRVLLADWAARLGTIGHLTALRRVSSGDHHVAEALSIEQLQERCEADERVLAPALSFVDHLTTVTASPEDLVRLRRGQLLMFVATETTSEVAVVDGAGILAGIVHRRGDGWQPDLVFPEEQPC